MADDSDALQIEEEETFEREQALLEMEAQLHAQEQGAVEMERAFQKRAKALSNLMSYVVEQGDSLRRRAEAIGPRAVQMVEPLVQGAGDDVDELVFGMLDERHVMLERRHELLEIRTQLMEEREGLVAQRHEALEGAETRLAEVEEQLLAREMEMAGVLRKLIMSAADLAGPADADEATAGSRRERKSNVVGREPMTVISGDVQAAKARGVEDSRRRRNRKPAKTSQVRFNLEARMDSDDGHHFFRYEDDDTSELPGLFVATHNLLKEDREVQVAIGLGGEALLRAKGIVAWRRKPDDEEGAPGMGIELTWLEDGAREQLDGYVAEHEPTQI